MSKPDGGPAFPQPITSFRQWESLSGETVMSADDDSYGGMSLRDYFAAKCYIVTLRSVRDESSEYASDMREEEDFDGAARDAYRRADALLKARESPVMPSLRQPLPELEEGPSRLDGGLHLDERRVELSSWSDEALWDALARRLRVLDRAGREGEQLRHV